MTSPHVPVRTRQDRRDRRRAQIAAAKASRAVPATETDPTRTAVRTVWSRHELPAPPTAETGVPFSEGVSSVFAGSLLYLPVALVTGFSAVNYPIAAGLVIVLSYALISRRVVTGPGYVAVRKFGPYRVASEGSLMRGALIPSHRGGVLTLQTGDGRMMRLRRCEFTEPSVNSELRRVLLSSGQPYDGGVMQLLDLPWRADFGHQRYLLDAVQ